MVISIKNIAATAKRIFMYIVIAVVFIGLFSAHAITARADEKDVVRASSKYSTGVYDPNGTIEIKLLVAAIDPTLTSLDGTKYWNRSTSIKASEYLALSLDESVTFWCDTFEEVSHNSLEINVVDTIIINEFPKYKSVASLDNESFQRIFKKDSRGYGDWYGGVTCEEYRLYDSAGDLDYNYYVDKLDLVNKRNAGEFDVLLLVGVDPLSPYESCMVGRTPFWINGSGVEADCDNFIVITPTFSRKDGSIENVGHMAEQLLGYNYGMINYTKGCIDGSNYAALNDWQKYCLCEYLATPGTKIYGYGMVHFSPNSTADYDWNNDTKVKYYKDWRNGTDVQYFTATGAYLGDTIYNYNNDACISHHKWWFSNMPYSDGRDKDGYFRNWWRYIFTPDYVTSLCPDSSYSQKTIRVNIGDDIPVKLGLKYYSGKVMYTDSVASEAAIIVGDSSLLSVSNGKVRGLAKGTTTLELKIDGKSVIYTVNIMNREDSDLPAKEALVGCTLDLKNGSLWINILTDLSDEYNNCYAKIAFPDGTVSTIRVSNAAKSQYDNGQICRVFTAKIAAKDIFDKVKLIIYDEYGNEDYVISVSIYDYAKALKSKDSKYASFVDAMLRYGAYAHKYFYGTNPTGYSFDKQYTAADYTRIAQYIYLSKGITNSGYVGSSLILKDDVTLRHYFTEPVTGYTQQKDGVYYMQLTVNPTRYNVALYGYSFTVNDYIKLALTGNNDAALKNLVSALYEYGIEANKLP